MKSKLIALSAISASFVAILLTLGAYIELIDLLTLVFASAFVILPLYYKSFLGSFLTYLAGGILAFMFSGFNVFSIVFPSYFAFFGLYPVVKHLMRVKGVNGILAFFIGLVWCVLAFYGIYFYYIGVIGYEFNDFPSWLNDYLIYAVAGVGVIFYLIFDRFVLVIKFAIDKYLQRIIK